MKSTCKYCNTEHMFLRTDNGDGKIQQTGYWDKGTPFCERLKNRDEAVTPFLICDVSKEKQCGFYEPNKKSNESYDKAEEEATNRRKMYLPKKRGEK